MRGCHVVALALALGTTVSVGCRSKPLMVEEAAVAGPSCSNTTSDSANCGACGQACFVGPCQSSTCRVRLLTWLRRQDNYDFAVDERHVYYVAAYAGSVARVRIDGGPREILATKAPEKDLQPPQSMALSKDSVFWTWNRNHIHTMKKDGGTPTELFVDTDHRVDELGAPDGDLWWTSARDMSTAKNPSQLNHLVGGKKVQVGLAFEGRGPTFDATSVVFMDPDKPGTLVEIPHATKQRLVLARELGQAYVAQLDATSVYLVTADGIKQVPRRTPGPVRTIYTTGKDDHILGTDLGAQHLWVVLSHSAVRVSLADGSVTPLADRWAPLEGYLLGGNTSGLFLLLVESKSKMAKRAIVRIDK